MTRLVPRLAAALLLITLAGSGFAQFGGGMGGGGMGGGMGGRRGSGGGGNTSTPRSGTIDSPTTLASAASSRLYDLRLRLRITQEQSASWDAFQTKAWDLLVHNAVHAPGDGDGDVTAAQAVRARADRLQMSAQRWSALADAVDHLYQTLSPEQRQVADQELPTVLSAGAEGSEGQGAPGRSEPSGGGPGFRKGRQAN